ncbi:hypothetical protein OJAV_G00233740 [Oryzias javanicus]|uniref:Uncharacterized protein n=1 Tax=Oryzias javanicus TaxID=123683 RepID=A0A437C0D8_ORYJA|nr:hypothetical protein OJAV_G00233740 [Oryzias javanicus]
MVTDWGIRADRQVAPERRRTHLLSVCLQRNELRQRSGSPALRTTFSPPIGRLFEPVAPFPRPLWISNNRVPPVQKRLLCQRRCCCHLGNAQTEGHSEEVEQKTTRHR